MAELADEVEEEEELEEEGEEEEEEEVDDEESEQEEGGEQQQAAVLWSGFDPAAHQLNRADKRSVWRCASSEGGAAVKFAALCCSGARLSGRGTVRQECEGGGWGWDAWGCTATCGKRVVRLKRYLLCTQLMALLASCFPFLPCVRCSQPPERGLHHCAGRGGNYLLWAGLDAI